LAGSRRCWIAAAVAPVRLVAEAEVGTVVVRVRWAQLVVFAGQVSSAETVAKSIERATTSVWPGELVGASVDLQVMHAGTLTMLRDVDCGDRQSSQHADYDAVSYQLA
jgi:hypothetical protein